MDKEAGIPGAAEGPSRRRRSMEESGSLWLGPWQQYGSSPRAGRTAECL